MKIVYVSGVKFGYSLLEEILEHNFEISAVISYSDSKKSIYSDFASFDSICNKFNIQNIKVNNKRYTSIISEYLSSSNNKPNYQLILEECFSHLDFKFD